MYPGLIFASSALNPLSRVREGSPSPATICALNPFSHAVELIRFAFYAKVELMSLAVVAACMIVFRAAAVIAYDPARGMLMRRGA